MFTCFPVRVLMHSPSSSLLGRQVSLDTRIKTWRLTDTFDLDNGGRFHNFSIFTEIGYHIRSEHIP